MFLWPAFAITLPIGKAGCQFENEVRKMFGAQAGPVASFAPAFGMMSSVLVSRATFTIAMATPECTVPTTTSTFSRPTRRFMLSVAASGFDSSSTCTKATWRPPSLPPFCSTFSLKASSMNLPSFAKVPV